MRTFVGNEVVWSSSKCTGGSLGGNSGDSTSVLTMVYPAGGRVTGDLVEIGATDFHYCAHGYVGSYTTDGLVALVNSGANLLPMTIV